MTEKEKAVSGILYNAEGDKTLCRERLICKELCRKYNKLKPKSLKKRRKIISKLLGSHKNNFHIEQPFFCDYGYNISIGEGFYANHHTVILDVAKVTFGDNVFIAPNCGFYTAGHPLNFEERNAGLEFGLPITVGDNVWIGGNVTVLPNVTIGSGSVIGAGSVVTKDIPPNVIAVGNPCRVVREITADDDKKLKRE